MIGALSAASGLTSALHTLNLTSVISFSVPQMHPALSLQPGALAVFLGRNAPYPTPTAFLTVLSCRSLSPHLSTKYDQRKLLDSSANRDLWEGSGRGHILLWRAIGVE